VECIVVEKVAGIVGDIAVEPSELHSSHISDRNYPQLGYRNLDRMAFYYLPQFARNSASLTLILMYKYLMI
jgi:hypothetical protein